MGPFVRYTLLRLAVLAAVGAALWLVGLRGLLWAALSVALAAGLSYLLLARARAEVLAVWDAGREARGAGRPRVSDEEAEDAAATPPDEPPGGADPRA